MYPRFFNSAAPAESEEGGWWNVTQWFLGALSMWLNRGRPVEHKFDVGPPRFTTANKV
jgi:hypothetical protein